MCHADDDESLARDGFAYTKMARGKVPSDTSGQKECFSRFGLGMREAEAEITLSV
jgi:hypothetical protein